MLRNKDKVSSDQEVRRYNHLLRFLSNQTFVTNEKTFEYEDTLPKLPLPSLSRTLEVYLDSVKAVASEEEFINTLKEVNRFKKCDGKILQDKLIQHERNKKNWVEHWWLEYGYLKSRLPLVPYNTMVSYPYIMSSFWPLGDLLFLEYGSHVIAALGEFYDLIREEKLVPQKNSSGIALSMHQTKFIFNSCRIPGNGVDSLVNSFKTVKQGSSPSHVVVLIGGHIFKVNLYNSADKLKSQQEWRKTLEILWNTYIKRGRHLGVAALTCDSRQLWFENRQYLKDYSPSNAEALDNIESAAFSISIYDECPTSDLLKKLISTDPENKWADISLCLALFRNGFGGIVADHTPFDAMVLLQLGLYIASSTVSNVSKNKSDVTCPLLYEGDDKVFDDINFEYDEFIKTKVGEAVFKNKKLMDDLNCEFFVYENFGKSTLKKFRLHPDGVFQAAIQLAYYRIHKRLASVYETATTRKYYHGRTETIRSCTKEMASFILSFEDPTLNKIEKQKLLHTAVTHHVSLVAQCEQNGGCDRHLFGLYMMAIQENMKIPELYEDPMFLRTGGFGNFNISSSLNGYTGFAGGIAPMPHDDCYGCFYSYTDDSIIVFLSSWNHVGSHDINHYFGEIAKALDDFCTLCSLKSQL